MQFDAGFVGVGSIGYGLGNGLRFELEGDYRQNKAKSNGPRATPIGVGGDEEKYGAMFNVLYDFDPSVFGLGAFPVVPYVGVGAGYMWDQGAEQPHLWPDAGWPGHHSGWQLPAAIQRR